MHIAPDQIPLRWPEGRERVPASSRIQQHPPWGPTTLRQNYIDACGALGVAWAQLSMSCTHQEPAVVCYFEIIGVRCALSSDRFSTCAANLYAITMQIKGLRSMRSIQGETAVRQALHALRLNAHIPEWCTFYGFEEIPERTVLEKTHKKMVFASHPDRDGGSEDRMRTLNAMIEAARAHYES